MTHDEMIKIFTELSNGQLHSLGIRRSVRNVYKYNNTLKRTLTKDEKNQLLHAWLKELGAAASTKQRKYLLILESFVPKQEWEHMIHTLGYPSPGRIIPEQEIESAVLHMLNIEFLNLTNN